MGKLAHQPGEQHASPWTEQLANNMIQYITNSMLAQQLSAQC